MLSIVYLFSYIIPITYAVMGYLFWKQTPDLNGKKSGWRSSYSTKNEETWQFANQIGGRYLFLMGIIEFILVAVVYFLARDMNREQFYFVVIVLCLLALETGSFSYLNKYIDNKLKKM